MLIWCHGEKLFIYTPFIDSGIKSVGGHRGRAWLGGQFLRDRLVNKILWEEVNYLLGGIEINLFA